MASVLSKFGIFAKNSALNRFHLAAAIVLQGVLKSVLPNEEAYLVVRLPLAHANHRRLSKPLEASERDWRLLVKVREIALAGGCSWRTSLAIGFWQHTFLAIRF